MSKTIDERVVSMQFDNKHFESNVRTTMSTLDKLKQKLNLPGASKSFESVSAAAKKCDISPLSSAVDKVGLRFSAMYTVADQALRNITTSVQRTAANITKAFTIDPIRTGLSEYETQIGAVQTILANTSSKGSTLDDVNAALDTLNEYADKTIYNFTEMTRNIGTFTAAGVDLDKSVTSIKGIANLAAVSGSTSQQASTAMYQLSQALAAGKVQLMDWNSVVNAGMGGQVFQDALKRTAKQLGYNVDEMIKKYGSFRESLTQGEWLTAEVLTETLTQLSGAYSEADLIAQGYSEKQAKEIVALADTAVNAATKVKTFTQLLDTTKEALQSGWTQTWELIIGDFEEAKEFWTNIADKLTGEDGIITKMSDARNKLLGGALNSNYDKLISKVNEAGIETTKLEDEMRKVAKAHDVDLDAVVEKYGSLEKAFQKGAISGDILRESLNNLFRTNEKFEKIDFSTVDRDLKNGFKGDDVKKIEQALIDLGYKLTGKDGKFYGDDGYFGTLTRDAIKEFQKANGLKITGIVDEETLAALEKAHDAAYGLNSAVSEVTESFNELIDGIEELGGRELIIESFKNVFEGLGNLLAPIKEAFAEVFPPATSEQLYNLIEGFHKLTENFKSWTEGAQGQKTIENIKIAFTGLFTVVKSIVTVVKKVFGAGLQVAGKAVSLLFRGVSNIGAIVSESVLRVKEWVGAFLALPEVQAALEKIKMAFSGITEAIKGRFGGAGEQLAKFIERVKSLDGFSLENIKKALTFLKEDIIDYFIKTDAGTIFDGLINAAKNLKTKISTYLESAGVKFDEIVTKIKGFVKSVKEYLGDNAGGIIALGSLIGFFVMIKKVKDAVQSFSDHFGFLDDIGDTIKSFGKSLQFSVKTKAMQNIAVSIAILAGSLAVLAMLPVGKLWSAVGALVLVTGVLVGVMFAINKIPEKSLTDLGKLSASILSISGSLLVFALAAKTIAGLDGAELGKCGLVILGFVGVMALMSKVKISDAANFAAFGSMMIGLSAALIIFSVAIGILGRMELSTLVQGGAAVAVFLVMMAGMMAATRGLKKDLPKFATTMSGLAAALLLFSISVGILGNMDIKTLVQGGAAVGAFLLSMVVMMGATRLLSKDMPRFAGTMFGLSAGLLAMAVAVRLIGNMDTGAMVKGGIVMTAFLTMMIGMMAATRLLTKNSKNAGKIGLMILSFAGAMLILTASIALLSTIDGADLAKATAVIAGVGLIFAGMLALTKYAKSGKGIKTTIMSMAIAVGILAVSIAALSLIDPSKLAGASVALSLVMGMFAVMNTSAKSIGLKSIGTMLVLVGVVGLLGAIIHELSDIPADGALKIAGALSALILSLSASCLLLSSVGAAGPSAFIGIGVLAALLGVVGIFAAIAIASLPKIGSQLSDFMNNLSGFISGAEKIKPEMANGIKTLAEAILILTSSSMLDMIGSWFSGGKSPLENFGSGMKSFGKDLAQFLKDIGEVTSDLAGTPEQATIFWDNITKATDTAVKLAEVANSIPDTSGWSTLFGQKDIGAFGDQIASFAQGLSTYLTAVGGKFTSLNSAGEVEEVTVNWDNVDKATGVASELATLAGKIPDTSGWTAELFGKKDLGAFGDQIATFANGLGAYLVAVGGKFTSLNSAGEVEEVDINWENVGTATGVAGDLADIATKIPDTSGWTVDTFAKKDLGAFGDQIASFANGLGTYLIAVGGKFTTLNSAGEIEEVKVNWENVGKATSAASELAKAASTIPDTSGWTVDTFAKKDLGAFGDQIATFTEGLCSYLGAMSGKFTTLNSNGQPVAVSANWTNINNATGVAGELAKIAESAPDTSGWSVEIFGKKDLGAFGDQIATFAGGLATYLGKVSGKFTTLNAAGEVEEVTANWDNITKAAGVAKELAAVAETIPDTEGWSTIFGKKDLGTFGTQVATFANGLGAFINSLNNAFGSGSETKVDVDFDVINDVVAVANNLASMAKTVGDNSEGWEWLTGKDGLDAFGTKIESLGESLKLFCSSVSGESFDMSAVSSAIAEVEKFMNVAKGLTEEKLVNLETLGGTISAFGGDINGLFDDLGDVDTTQFSAIADGISKLASVNVSNADMVKNFVDSLGTISADGVNKFAEAFEKSAPKVLQSISLMMRTAVLGIKTRGAVLKAAVENVVNSAASAANSLKARLGFVAAGIAMAQGFANGISSGTFLAVAKATAMALAALAAAKLALKINSPSKEFIKIGKSIPEGFAMGIETLSNRVTGSVVSLAEKAVNGTKNAISRITDAINADVNMQPTIRPVIDLSDIADGANAIDSMFGMTPSVGLMSNVGTINSMMTARQNGVNNGDIIDAIKDLGAKLAKKTGDSYSIGSVGYDDDSSISNAVKSLVRAVKMERRI